MTPLAILQSFSPAIWLSFHRIASTRGQQVLPYLTSLLNPK